HPTTRDCIRAMAYLGESTRWNRVLDLGTGTGILALIAAYLGAKEVLALDVNPLSIKTARRNVQLNHLEDTISVIEGRAEDFIDETADLILANLHYEVIARLIDSKGFHAKTWSILSGIMRSQVRELRPTLERSSLEIIKEWDHGAIWYTLLLRSKV
ncbi:MAG: 50S ribosomal protein L11 methyltransferase, partial [Pseudomonadota bacterium]